ncbi:MAG: GGDEF domain-containing protein [Oscillospiraceae bacterium]
MVQYSQILTADASALLLMVLLKLHMNRQAKISPLIDARLLSAMINLTMFQCLLDMFVFWVDGKTFPAARELNIIGNIVYYILNVTIAYLWPLFTEYKLNCSIAKLKKLAILSGIPLALTAIGIVLTPLSGFLFTITEDNRYTRTELNFLLPTVLIFIYLLIGTIKVYIHRRNKGKYMIFPVIYFVTPIVIAVTVQAFFYGISLIYIGIAIGLTGIYISTQSESAYIDQLCGVYNRRYYNDYIRAFCNAKNKSSAITGALIDMDNFKPINDNFGHDVGDEALVKFSSILRKNMSEIGFVVRFGGDEFVLVTNRSEGEIENAVSDILKELDEVNASGENRYKLEFSYGISSITADSSSDDFLKTMDSRMYEMKNKRKLRK